MLSSTPQRSSFARWLGNTLRGRLMLLEFMGLSLLLTTFSTGFMAVSPARASTDLAQYVNPQIASGKDVAMTGHEPYNGYYGQENPGENVPFAMINWGPQTHNENNQAADYVYDDTALLGFPLINQHYFGGLVPFLPYAGSIGSSPGTNFSSYTTTIDHSTETAQAGYYKVSTGSSIQAQLTGDVHSAYGRFTYPSSQAASLLITTNKSVSLDTSAHKISGQGESGLYFVALFDRSFDGYGTWSGSNLNNSSSSASGSQSGAYVTFNTASNQTVQVRVGASWVSLANAQSNLDSEIPASQSFDTTKSNAYNKWNNVLNRLVVEDSNASTDDLTIFYSALYRALLYPTIYSDVNGEYVGWDSNATTKTVSSGHSKVYSGMSSWDAGHGGGQFQLLALMFPDETSDMIQSYVDASTQSGNWARRIVLGRGGVGDSNHSSDYSIPAMAYSFGATNFNTGQALNVLYNTATNPTNNPTRYAGLSLYLQNGYVPTDFRGGADYASSVEATLTFSTADFANSQLARLWGDNITYNELASRSDNWKNVFYASASDNGYSGYAWGKNSGGNFENFTNSADGSDQSGSYFGYFQEASTAQETWAVPQNLAGLISALGGSSTVVNRLDSYFDLSKLNDGDGSKHAYMGNEPQLGVPWVYDWAGAPSHAQNVVRQTQLSLFKNNPTGTPGNDDWGALSSWYVWSALGMYPEIPGVAGVALHSPFFAKITLNLENSHTIVINGNHAAHANPYVQSLSLNGNSYDSPWLPLSEFVNANSTNTLTFELGSSASNWGSSPTINPPPSFDAPGQLPNLAIGKTVTTSANATTCASSEAPSNAVDGSTSTKWCGYGSGAAWLKLDLGQNYNVLGFVVKHAGAGGESASYNTRDFKIQSSSTGDDNGTWTDLATVTGNTTNVSLLPITPASLRWVRLYISAGQQDGANTERIYEFGVYGGSNLAQGKNTSSNLNSCASNELPQYAVDGVASTKWCAYGGTGWLKVDLGQNYNLVGFRLKHAGSNGESVAYNTRDFKIQTSTDGSDSGTWTDLLRLDANTQNITTNLVPVKNARYVRLYVTAGQQDRSQVERIYEFEVYTN